MPTINVSVQNKHANSSSNAKIVCGNSDYEIKFAFDSEWDEYSAKTARFIWNGAHQDVAFTGSVCKVPIINDARMVTVGVFAGDLHTTTPARITAEKSILCDSGAPAAPSDDVYNQLMELLQNLVDRVEVLEQGGVVDVATAKLGEAILGRLKLR